ncbi:glycoside hydrolase family 20 zincin-like fold domain-containing protein [Catellatospora bangladeshensis]|uniref:glycoside hydrolase family 20 zincin-like fold domain-containing protein n=1 Tax=Catellatospora bangladeshensis TaxID=310355 RepID=UPI00360FB017
MLIPQPTSYSTAPGHHELTAATAVHAPAEIAALLRELLSPVTGLPLPDAAAHAAELLFTLDTTETELGEEGYRLTVGDDGVRAVAGTLAGLRWAVQALRQLLPPAACGSTPPRAWPGWCRTPRSPTGPATPGAAC